jgi:hypothetical protein
VLLIDPLASDSQSPPWRPENNQIFDIVSRLVLSPIAQDRLDTLDLAQINDETIFSRFMIAPSRRSPDGKTAWPPSKSLMGAPLGGFLGFAAKAFREHDFLLGRRNAQRFLAQSFCLPAEHSIFEGTAGWTADEDVVDAHGRHFRPLIPLRGRAADIQPVPIWDWQALTDADIDRYLALAKKRADAVFGLLGRSARTRKGVGGWFIGAVLGCCLFLAWRLLVRPGILGKLKTALCQGRESLNPATDRTRPASASSLAPEPRA